jgi:hypothetical protein
MKKNKNSHGNKQKTKFDKANTKNKKEFRNRCLVSDNNEIDATNREIIDKIELDTKNINISSEEEEEEEEDINKNINDESDQELENNSDSYEDEEPEINKENFNIKLYMLVFTKLKI